MAPEQQQTTVEFLRALERTETPSNVEIEWLHEDAATLWDVDVKADVPGGRRTIAVKFDKATRWTPELIAQQVRATIDKWNRKP